MSGDDRAIASSAWENHEMSGNHLEEKEGRELGQSLSLVEYEKRQRVCQGEAGEARIQ